MIKHYVLDTNVLLYDPNSIFMFEDNYVHIPMVVLEELDTFKKDMNELGRNARHIIGYLDALRVKGKLCDGVELDSGGTLFVSSTYEKIDTSLSVELLDNKLLQLSAYLKTLNHGTSVVLVTKDINLRVKADALNIEAQDYKKPSEGNGTDYDGVAELTVSGDFIDKVYEEDCAEIDDDSLFSNQYLILTDASDPKHTGLGVHRNGKVYPIRKKCKAVSISPNNVRQTFAFDALLNPDMKVVTISGVSGTGKTLMTVAAAIQQTLIENNYHRITITRPIVSVGNELGFLPGDIEDKLDPWTKPIYDSLDLIKSLDKKSGKSKIPLQLEPEDYIEVSPLCYIRGRSLIDTFMVIDESQNLSPLEVKTIVTRAGQGTKIVLTGDVHQIDCPYLNRHSNGLSQLIKKFKGQGFYAHITLTEGERSEVAEAAARLL